MSTRHALTRYRTRLSEARRRRCRSLARGPGGTVREGGRGEIATVTVAAGILSEKGTESGP